MLSSLLTLWVIIYIKSNREMPYIYEIASSYLLLPTTSVAVMLVLMHFPRRARWRDPRLINAQISASVNKPNHSLLDTPWSSSSSPRPRLPPLLQPRHDNTPPSQSFSPSKKPSHTTVGVRLHLHLHLHRYHRRQRRGARQHQYQRLLQPCTAIYKLRERCSKHFCAKAK